MKRLFSIIVLASIASLGFVSQSHAAVNDFTITRFEADYYIDKDTDDRSTMRTVEKITAEFPAHNQNHGIERAIPKKYDGHSTDVSIESVTDGTGKKVPYEKRSKNDNLVLRIGDKDAYVHGSNTYIISYTQRDVTKQFNDRDELYWDVNGTEWKQPFGTVEARVHLSSAVASALNGDRSCYQGLSGSTEQC